MNEIALLQFVQAKGVGDSALRRLAACVYSENISPADVVRMHKNDLAILLDIKPHIVDNIYSAYDQATHLNDQLLQNEISIIWMAEDNYPDRLKETLGKYAPPVLFVRGNIDLLNTPSVGFCGSRKASDRGLEITRVASRILVENDISVISGYASGVDCAAHCEALAANGTTIFVLVDGILKFRIKKVIEDKITNDNHLIVSQFPPNLPWISSNAMKRNGTIIGLSDAMILVESGNKGGTYSAGKETLKRKHPLYVVDFDEPGPSAQANPYFIANGGIPIRGNGNGIPNMRKVIDTVQCAKSHKKKSLDLLFGN